MTGEKQQDGAANKGRRSKTKRRAAWIVGSILLAALLVLGAAFATDVGSNNSSSSSVASSGASSGDLQARRVALSQLTVPENGAGLYRFMMKHIPDIVSEVPCSCCGESLAACFQGRCPST